MKKTIKLAMVSLLAILLFVGCVGDVGYSVVKTEATIELNASEFDLATGTVTKDIEIKAGNTGTTMSIPAETVLHDIDGEPITTVPTLEVKVEKSVRKSKTTFNFETESKKVIPTESVVFSVVAPTGAKVGEEVQIEVDDGIESTQKLILVIVKADGTVDIRIFPRVFKRGLIVIVVKLKIDISTN